MNRTALILSLTLSIWLAPLATVARSDSVGPLFGLLGRIPLDARGWVVLNDYAAVATQVAPFTAGLPPDHPSRLYLPFGTLAAPNGFDVNSLFGFSDGAVDALGFSIFEIDQMAGWGKNPHIGLVLTGIAGQPGRMKSALLARDFAETAIGPHIVWHRQDDFQVDFSRRLEEPFAGADGMSQRFSIVDEHLLFSRSWQVMEHALDGTAALASDGNASAILQAGYEFAGAGTLISAYLMAGQPLRQSASPESASSESASPGTLEPAGAVDPANPPALPAFPLYGVLLWQNGATMTGAIAIPYTSAEAAESAIATFSTLLEVVQSPSVRKPMTELLPTERRFEVIDTGQRKMVILAFETTHTISQPIGIATFTGNPLQRLMTMALRDELGLLIGR